MYLAGFGYFLAPLRVSQYFFEFSRLALRARVVELAHAKGKAERKDEADSLSCLVFSHRCQ